MLPVTILALETALASSVTITIDVLAMANHVSISAGRPAAFDVRLVGAGAHLFRPFLAFPEAAHDQPELLIVPAQGLSKAASYANRLAEPDAQAARALIEAAAKHGAHVASSCTGTLLLASTGLMDRRRATTAWWLAPIFHELFPGVALDTAELVVSDGGFTTAGAAMAQMDLMVGLIARYAGADVAEGCTRRMLLDERRSHESEISRHDARWRYFPENWLVRHALSNADLATLRTIQARGTMSNEHSQADALDDFSATLMSIDGIEKTVHVAGEGPAVIVMPEMPGISPQVARFARWVRDAGFRVYMPSLFGRDGAAADAEHGAAVFRRACVSAEFRALGGGGASSPVTRWLMGLARNAHDEFGGLGVGAVGMCFTGNFALTMMLEPAVRAPVLCQPALPLDNPAGIEIAQDEIEAVGRRMAAEDLTALAFRFAGDPFCRAARFDAYRDALGDRFHARVLPDEAANQDVPPFFAEHVPAPHSVVTAHLVDEAGSPTLAARDEILAFLRLRLTPDL